MVKKYKYRFDREKFQDTGDLSNRPRKIEKEMEILQIGKLYTGMVIEYGKLGDPVVFAGSNNPYVIIKNCRNEIPAVGDVVTYKVTDISSSAVFACLIQG